MIKSPQLQGEALNQAFPNNTILQTYGKLACIVGPEAGAILTLALVVADATVSKVVQAPVETKANGASDS